MERFFNFKLIEDYRLARRLTVTEFCEKCNIPRNVYYNLKRNNLKVEVKYLLKLTNEMQINPAILFISMQSSGEN